MKHFVGLTILLFAIVSCSDSPDEDCFENITMTVSQIVVPDSARLAEPMSVEVEVVRPDSRYRYIGPDTERTDLGCVITIKGVIDWCDMGYPAVVYEWHSFELRPDKTGEYIIEVIGGRVENLTDTTIVY